MDYAESDFTAPKVHQFFKKKFPDVMIGDVFEADSDYNEGRAVSELKRQQQKETLLQHS